MPFTTKIFPTTTNTQLVVVPDATYFTPGVVTLGQVQAASGATILVSIADFPPASGTTGEFFVDSTTGILYYSNGTTYVPVSDPTGPLSLFVDPVNGNDSNPGTELLPFQTFFAAVNALPPNWRKNAVINCAPGTYELNLIDFPDPTVIGTLLGHPGFGPQDPWLYVNGAYTNVLGDLTASVASDGTTITAAITTVTDAYFGQFIQILTGNNAGDYRTIVDNNNAGQFTVNVPFDNPVTMNDTFRVITPSVIFNVGGASGFMPFSTVGRIQFNAIKWNIPNGIAFGGPNGSGGCYQFSGCDFDFQGTGSWGQEGCAVQFFSFDNYAFGSTLRNGTGFVGGDVAPGCEAGFHMALQNMLVLVTQGSSMLIYSIFTRNSNIQLDLGSIITINGANAGNGTGVTFSEFRGDQGYAPISLFNRSIGVIDGVTFGGCTGNAINVETASYVNISSDADPGGGGNVPGAGVGNTPVHVPPIPPNNGVGISVFGPGSVAMIYGAGTLTTVSGTTGDVFLNGTGGGVVAYAAIVGGADGGVTTDGTLNRAQSV